MSAPTRPHLGLPLLSGGLLAMATPPALLPGAEFLVVAGLAAWFVVARDARRPRWHGYLLGAVHMAWFSWSIVHLMAVALALIVLLGGCYYVFANSAVRAVPERWRGVAFVLASAGSFWARSVMPEIYYPHGQPCHALYEWPALLRPVAVGGEALGNVLLAALAVALVTACERRRHGVALVRACAAVVAVLVAWTGLALLAKAGVPAVEADAPRVRVAAIEPGYHLIREGHSVPEAQRSEHLRSLFEARLLAPTRTLWGQAPIPDVVLWPESSVPTDVPRSGIDDRQVRLLPGRLPPGPDAARLVLGANVTGGDLPTPAALLLDARGAVLGWQEKRRLVPGGEFQPLFGCMPAAWADGLRDLFERALGTLPSAVPGRERLPLVDARGVPFGALLCYDNAFAEPAAAQVAAGARWLAVLSNEAWYEAGGELRQLVAMTVLRALETATPVVRCTQDGWSCWVDRDGVVRDGLPILPSPQPGPRILHVDLPVGAGRLPSLAWLRPFFGPAVGLGTAVLFLLGLVRWAKLRAA
ncbi:MAG: apolipoprotein N-acyltransferase [Planctomycetes bacterium]|nr:apolipoprotein N-acyltransferase [Planctomycetota bacterium]